MLRHIIAAAIPIASPVAAQQIVTSPVRLVDNSPATPGIVIVKARTTPKVKKGTSVFPCAGGPPWRYSVGVPCTASATPTTRAAPTASATPTTRAAPTASAAPIAMPAPALSASTNLAKAAVPRHGATCKDLGASAQWTYAARGGTYGNTCITRALDAVPLDGALDEPRVIQDITVANSRHFITQRTTKWRPFSNVTVQRIDVTARKRGIFIRGGSHDWLIQDFRITGSGVNTSPGDIPVGIGMAGATNITIRRGEISGFRTVLADKGKYANADCISAERGDSFTATDVYAHDCSDGIIDTKATTRLDRIRAANAGHFSYRFWAKADAGTLTSENPGYAHVQLAAASADVHIAKLIAIGGGDLVKVDKPGGTLTIDACDLTRWTGTALVTGAKAMVNLGKGCAAR